MKPADILVFDRLSLPGGPVQWGDESPANHAAIVVNAIHAIEANRVHGNKHAPAVQPVAIDSYVKDRANRTITILRHRGVGPDSKGAAGSIVERARQYDREADQYAYIDVIPVGLLALHRMDGEQLRARLGWAFRHAMDAIVHQVRMCVQDNKKTLMCSEFVYRCYTEFDAHLAIAIDDPLLTYCAAIDFLVADPSINFLPHYVDLVEEPPELALLWRDILSTKHTYVPPEPEPPDFGIQAFGIEAYGLLGFGRHTDTAQPHTGDPVPDAVSPGDLWRSSSLIPIAAFHRPPERPWVRPGEEVVATALDQLVVDPG